MLHDSSQFIDNQPTPYPTTGLGGGPSLLVQQRTVSQLTPKPR
jgi:hypothetical protein